MPVALRRLWERMMHRQLFQKEGAGMPGKSLLFPISAFIAGLATSLVESACTGQLYIPVIAIISRENQGMIHLLLIYNLAFIMPLLIISGVMILVPGNRTRIQGFFQQGGFLGRLATTLILIALFLWIVLT